MVDGIEIKEASKSIQRHICPNADNFEQKRQAIAIKCCI
jgi:hypothetical protein